MRHVLFAGIALTVAGRLYDSNTTEGIGIMILALILLWLLFGDDDRAHLFRMFVLPIIITIGVVYLGGLFIGKLL